MEYIFKILPVSNVDLKDRTCYFGMPILAPNEKHCSPHPSISIPVIHYQDGVAKRLLIDRRKSCRYGISASGKSYFTNNKQMAKTDNVCWLFISS